MTPAADEIRRAFTICSAVSPRAPARAMANTARMLNGEKNTFPSRGRIFWYNAIAKSLLSKPNELEGVTTSDFRRKVDCRLVNQSDSPLSVGVTCVQCSQQIEQTVAL